MKSIIGPELILQTVPDILSDESKYSCGIPERVYYPETTGDIIDIMRLAFKEKMPVTSIGAQTGITGGAVPVDGCIALCFKNMNKILRIEKNGNNYPILFCQPGILLSEIIRFLENPGDYPERIPGCEYLEGSAWFYPPDPTELSAQLGGSVATNASGSRSFYFGPTRNYIHSLSVVLANGESATLRRNTEHPSSGNLCLITDQGTRYTVPPVRYVSPKLKNASGYYHAPCMELIDLFIGSEGTIAVFSEIGIRLIPAPRLVGVLTFFPSRKQAFAFADFLRKLKYVAAIEYFDETALTFINQNRDKAPAMLPEFPAGARAALYWEYSETDLEPFESSTDAIEAALIANGSSFESSWSGIDRKESSLLKAFRHSVPECINQLIASYKALYPVIRKIGTDAALPGPAFEPVFETFLKLTTASKINTVIFGHIGDFHLHWNMLPKVPAEFEKAVEIYTVMMDCVISSGGTVSAEHGIGKLKVDYLVKMYGNDAMEEMKRIKEVFDPFRLLNPGNLFVFD